VQRLNVRQSQIIECIEKSMFAVDLMPRFSQGALDNKKGNNFYI
jgi:hypothetical protein